MIVKNGIKLKRFIDVFIPAIINNKKIAIFPHVEPDFDALGSAFGLKNIILNNFQNKEVRVIGMEKVIHESVTNKLFPVQDEIYYDNEEFMKEAIGISVDTPTLNRIIEKDLYLQTKMKFKIDHHQYMEDFSNYEYIESDASSACQLIVKIVLNSNLKIPVKAATYLYAGLLTDTNRFYFDIVNEETYQTAINLYRAGALRQLVHDVLYSRKRNQIEYENYLFSLAKFHDHVVSLFIPKDSNLRYGIEDAKGFIYVIQNIDSYPIWLAARWNEETGLYKVSLRSKKMPIFEIAKKYNGGGHLLASGCVVKDENEFNKLINDLVEAYRLYSKDENEL